VLGVALNEAFDISMRIAQFGVQKEDKVLEVKLAALDAITEKANELDNEELVPKEIVYGLLNVMSKSLIAAMDKKDQNGQEDKEIIEQTLRCTTSHNGFSDTSDNVTADNEVI
ncbi:hypothetical protein PMAYCL1PPCAC_28679, partial [Pristionchus mayeri]